MSNPLVLTSVLAVFTMIYRIVTWLFMPRSILFMTDYRFFVKEVISVFLIVMVMYIILGFIRNVYARLGLKLIMFVWVVFFMMVRSTDLLFAVIWKSHMQIPILFLKNDMNNFWDIVFSVQGIIIMLMIVMIVFSGYLIYRLENRTSNVRRVLTDRKGFFTPAIILVVMLIASLFTPNGGNSIIPEKEFITQMSVFRNFGKDKLTPVEMKELANAGLIRTASNEHPFLRCSVYDEPLKFMQNRKPNIILITVESLSDIFVSDYKGVMPNLSKFREGALSFTDCYNAAYPTNNGLFSILASQKTVSGVKRPYTKSVVKYLNEAGYSTHLVTSRHLYGFESDYDECFSFVTDHELSKHRMPDGITYHDAMLFDIASEVLRKTKNGPFFLHVMTESTHHPWPIDPKLPAFGNGENHVLTAYHQTDISIKKLFDTFFALGLNRNTVFIITADHAMPFTGGKYVSGNVDRIPLVFRFPDGCGIRGKNSVTCTPLDIAPTILHLAGINGENNFEGESLFGKTHSGVQLSLMLSFDLVARSKGRIADISREKVKKMNNTDLPVFPDEKVTYKDLFLYMKLMSNLDYYGTPMKVRRK